MLFKNYESPDTRNLNHLFPTKYHRVRFKTLLEVIELQFNSSSPYLFSDKVEYDESSAFSYLGLLSITKTTIELTTATC